MSESQKTPWYSARLSWVVWPVLIFVAMLVIGTVWKYYSGGDELFTPNELRQMDSTK